VRFLAISGIFSHHFDRFLVFISLKRLSDMKPPSGLSRKRFRPCASDILVKWALLCTPWSLIAIGHLRGAFFALYFCNWRWIFKWLYFIADQPLVFWLLVLRTSSEALSIVYGLGYEVPFPTLFWPDFMFSFLLLWTSVFSYLSAHPSKLPKCVLYSSNFLP